MWTCEQVVGASLDVDEVIDLYRAAELTEDRPVDDVSRFARMLAGSNLVVTARTADGRLVGIVRAVTDGVRVTHVGDLAVDPARRRLGIGLDLIAAAQAAVPDTRIVLLADAPAAPYYPHIGFARHESAWTLPGTAPRPRPGR
ncbi:GNAT family N-acetyltransferase (plasmid) [Streptomyces sp. BI20]|uniref:GNAT family N-acetyltransferase n=1 Tax=Streptomyces sp. BI20 TaxID=3403460 RepID=UPI003C781259